MKPRRLFIAADGPRAGNADDADRCELARRAVADVDWTCDIQTLFQDHNLGCKLGPETAIDWFLSNVSEGIILEDDCLPTPDFFPFCAELLERFRQSSQVMMIGGHNPLGRWPLPDASYVFSRTSPIWGWATWRRAWEHYDSAMLAWATSEGQASVRARMPAVEYRLTKRRFDSVHDNTLDAWDFAWAFAMLHAGGYSIIPTSNLIANIGFGADATHTKNQWSAEMRIPTVPMAFPLVHPTSIQPSADFEAELFKHRFPVARRFVTALPPAARERVRAALYRVSASVSRQRQ